MPRQRRSRTHKAHKGGVGTRKEFSTKHYGRDFDQIVDDTKDPKRVAQLTAFDEDQVGSFTAHQTTAIHCTQSMFSLSL